MEGLVRSPVRSIVFFSVFFFCASFVVCCVVLSFGFDVTWRGVALHPGAVFCTRRCCVSFTLVLALVFVSFFVLVFVFFSSCF